MTQRKFETIWKNHLKFKDQSNDSGSSSSQEGFVYADEIPGF